MITLRDAWIGAGAAIIVGLIGFMGVRMQTSSGARISEAPIVQGFEKRLTQLEITQSSLRTQNDAHKKTIVALEAQLNDMAGAGQDQQTISRIKTQIKELQGDIDALSDAIAQGAGAAEIDLDALASRIAQNHSEALRGPKGEAGPAGPKGDRGEPGPQGEPGKAGTSSASGSGSWITNGTGGASATATDSVAPSKQTIARNACLTINDRSPEIGNVTFKSGSKLCGDAGERYIVQCAGSNPAACMVEVVDILSGEKASYMLRDSGSLALDRLGPFTFYFTGSDNDAREIYGGVARN